MELRDQLQRSLASVYAIERELGGGGMSRVFVATESALDRPVVLKVLPPELAQAVSTERFRQEIRLAARLQHPHIVALLAAGVADGLLYYTMPFVEGESLRTRLARAGELPLRDAVRILRDVAAALAYAHEHGVVHRDIKPDNVLLSGGEALVTDFGVAKALSASATDGGTGLTSLGVALGTPAYMAPEQAAADPHLDHRADLYAFGCLAYEVLTGQPPFTGRPTAALVGAHLTERPEPVERRRPALPAALAQLVMRSLEKRPADRPQTAGEVLEALESLATPSGGIEPTRVTHAAAGPRVAFRHRLFWGGTAALLLVGAGLGLWTRRHPTPAVLDENLVAVAPFDALGTGLDLWREGFVDLLSRNLDGAGPLTTVSPTLVIRGWSGRADPVSAKALGRRTGAGIVVFGSLVAAGPDSVRLGATILDVPAGITIGEVQLRGNTRYMDQMADSLSVSILRQLGRSRPVGAVRLTGLAGTSLPALKAFLQGEQHYRRSAWDSARVHYEEAIALDSALVPALLHLAHSIWWSTADTTYYDYMRRAARMNRGLAPRESLLVVADSLWVALVPELPDTTRRLLRRRLVGTMEHASRRYSSDPEVWYLLGEARVHEGWQVGATEDQMREAFDRAIGLDSAFAPGYVHQVVLGLWRDGVAGWDRYARPYLARYSPDQYTEAIVLLDPMLHKPASDTAGIDSLLAAALPSQLFFAVYQLGRVPDSAELGVRAARALAATTKPIDDFYHERSARGEILATALAHRGHIAEAYDNFRNNESPFTSVYGELALLGGIPADSAALTFARWLHERRLWHQGEPAGVRGLYFALPWWAERGDTLSLRRFVTRVDSVSRSSIRAPSGNLAYFGEAARAYLELARSDTTAALAGFAALAQDVAAGSLNRLIHGQLLARRGRDREALDLLDRELPMYELSSARVLWALERARVAERLKQRDKAVTGYQYVADAWRHADSVLRPYVQDARSGLERLTAEPSP
jgi:serine/threonine-protein kinase